MKTKIFILVLLGLLETTVWAHTTSQADIRLQEQKGEVEGQVKFSLADLEVAIGLDVNQDGSLTESEFKARSYAVSSYVEKVIKVTDCELTAGKPAIADVAGKLVASVPLSGTCQGSGRKLIRYTGLFALDKDHRAVAGLMSNGQESSLVFDGENTEQYWRQNSPSLVVATMNYVKEGVWHIWIGFDHILFLLTLLLPAVLYRREDEIELTLKEAAIDVTKIVTSFTLAHSITLLIVSFGWLSLESWLVESVIAASVLVAALNNIFPVLTEKRWTVAFGFGLIHGFGFASVLSDLGWQTSLMIPSILGFNVGVEIGQLVIVAIALPTLYGLKKVASWYYPIVLLGGSTVAVVISTLWIIDRILGLEFMPI